MEKKWWVIALVFIVMLGGGILVGVKVLAPRIAYVDNNVLYKSFKGKEVLEKVFIKDKEKEQAYMDSLYLGLTFLDKKIKGAGGKDIAQQREFLDKKRAFDELAANFENRNKELQSKYLEQIWTQINQYVRDYGKENHYDYILGATGNGSMMFANEKCNITPEVLIYINSKYDGK